jgi:N-acetylmuramoyl-L-alanine amidase
MLFIKKLIKPFNFLVFLLCAGICTSATTGTQKTPYRIKTIVIDPGHGGHDSGCLGSSAKEKHIALEIALKLGALIEEKFPEVNVVYTRKSDVFVELYERAAIANRNHADLFICIHCNSGGPVAFGAETYVMGLHKTEDNLNVAKRENATILLEKDYKQKYDGFDPNSPEANIIFSLYQNAYLAQSLKFASAIQQQFEEYAGRFNRGVKQAGFLVLYKTAMPSVLIETGFLTNKTEEKYLLSEKGQQNISQSIFKAFSEYKLDMESLGAKANAQQTSTTDVRKNIPELKTPAEEKTFQNNRPKERDSNITDDNAKKTTMNDSSGRGETTALPKKVEPLKSIENADIPKEEKMPEDKTTPAKPTEDKTVAEKKGTTTNEIKTAKPTDKNNLPELFYTIQIAALPDVTVNEMRRFDGINDIHTFAAENGMTRICQGIYLVHAKAVEGQVKMRNQGFKDAFVTPYYKGKRITIQQAAALKGN